MLHLVACGRPVLSTSALKRNVKAFRFLFALGRTGVPWKSVRAGARVPFPILASLFSVNLWRLEAPMIRSKNLSRIARRDASINNKKKSRIIIIVIPNDAWRSYPSFHVSITRYPRMFESKWKSRTILENIVYIYIRAASFLFFFLFFFWSRKSPFSSSSSIPCVILEPVSTGGQTHSNACVFYDPKNYTVTLFSLFFFLFL